MDQRRFVVEGRPEPAYSSLARSGELARRVERALDELRACRVCPRHCETDRLSALPPDVARRAMLRPVARAGRAPGREVPDHIPKGTACFTGRYARVSSSFPHFGEEDCLRGTRGSGTIFFSFCNLRCVFCQNWETSQAGLGVELTAHELAGRMLELQSRGCHNINLVTPEHVVPQALEALNIAAGAGLRLPLVYNTSAYDSAASLALLDGVVDIYMPDFKLWDPDEAHRLLKAADYPEVARRAVAEMHRQVGPLVVDADGLAVRGVLVRHLVMPGVGVEDARRIYRYLATEVSPDTYVNVMGQYYPAGSVTDDANRHPDIARKLAHDELAAARTAAREEGLWRLDLR